MQILRSVNLSKGNPKLVLAEFVGCSRSKSFPCELAIYFSDTTKTTLSLLAIPLCDKVFVCNSQGPQDFKANGNSILDETNYHFGAWTVWPSGLRRWLQAPVRKGVGSNPTAVIFIFLASAANPDYLS